MLTNSVIGICPVVRLGDKQLTAGEMTRQLQRTLKVI
jgi:branched-subunit amino acid aminotransferase/4-amino-4-deoxychorismate lyase